MKKILILTAGFGEGHNTAARNICEALQEHPDVTAKVVDIYTLTHPRVNKLLQKGYVFAINKFPFFWELFFNLINRPGSIERTMFMARHLKRTLGKLIGEFQPDVLISTYPLYSFLIHQLRQDCHPACQAPLVTVITDSTAVNTSWYRCPANDYLIVVDEETAAIIKHNHITLEKIKILGFPVAPRLAELATISRLSRPLSKLAEATGSQGVGEIHDEEKLLPRRIYEALNSESVDTRVQSIPSGDFSKNHESSLWKILYLPSSKLDSTLELIQELRQIPNLEVTVVTGRLEMLYAALAKSPLIDGKKIKLLGWTDQMPELLTSHHLYIGKAGGAIVHEAMSAQCPVLISHVVPGQEEGNIELIERLDIGRLGVHYPVNLAASVREIFSHDAVMWHRWRKHLSEIARPAASRNIAKFVLGVSKNNSLK